MSRSRLKNKQMFALIWILLFVFQSLLSKLSPIFSYIDEAPLMLFVMLLLIRIARTGKIVIEKENVKYVVAIILFMIIGLTGNMIYQYQPLKLVCVDLMTNLKFFGAIAFFSIWMDKSILENKITCKIVKLISVILMLFFVIDQIMDIFPSEHRYGIKSAALFYDHPTYLAGTCVFLIAIMTLYDSKKYEFYIFLNLIILIFTLRSKAIVGAIVYLMLYVIIKKMHCKLKIWQMVSFGIIGIICAWSQIYFYFIALSGSSARSVMMITSFLIIKDYFPIGTGFGTFASHSAAVNYSPVYSKYGFELIYELRNSSTGTFFDDQFWPIIFGQTGFAGTICYIYILLFLLKKIQKTYKVDMDLYISALFVFIYLMISSIAEPAFNNSIAVPLAMILAIIWKR